MPLDPEEWAYLRTFYDAMWEHVRPVFPHTWYEIVLKDPAMKLAYAERQVEKRRRHRALRRNNKAVNRVLDALL